MRRGLLVAFSVAACGPATPSAPGPTAPTASSAAASQAARKAFAEAALDAASPAPRGAEAQGDETPAADAPTPTPLPPAPSDPRDLRWLLIAGGPEPSSNQVQIADDSERAIAHLGPSGRFLFAGGPGSRSVLVDPEGEAMRGDPLLRRLGDFFAPRADRSARYRESPVTPHATADRGSVLTALEDALTAQTPNPLTVLLVGHGDHADGPDDAAFATWGGGWLTPPDLAPLVERATRPLRFIVATCYAGGWARPLFAHDGACGVYATTWDRVASGCDPDPDRRAQEGYLVRLFAALEAPAPERAGLDRDGDGRIGLLDAHIAAAASARGLEVPVASSSEYLLASAPEAGPEARAPLGPLPEESWLAAQLATQLADPATAPLTAARVDAKLAELTRAATTANDAVDDAADLEAAALATARGDALGRWPALDDPWHPDWVPTLATHQDAIANWLRTSPSYSAWRDATEALARAQQTAGALDAARTPWLRLARAEHTLAAARRLAALPAARAKPIWARFMALRTCERRPLP